MSAPSTSANLRATVARVHHALTDTRLHRVVVVGDVMLDRYVDGTSTRLSPEAPVPVIDVTTEIERLGGAANVAVGLARLGASVVLVGMVGDDADGTRVRALLAEEPGITAQLVVDPVRTTTAKERVRVDGRHVIRVDREHRDQPSPAVRDGIERATQDAIDGADVLVVSDYAKGAVDPRLISSLVGRPCTVVDPKHADVERYLGADVLAPNRAEALAAAAAASAPDVPTLAASVRALQARLPGTAMVVTCGADGVVWSEQGSESSDELEQLPSLARHVDDVTGAGDSVVCGLAAALAAGADLAGAVALASAVAAVAVESPGTATPTWAQIDSLIETVDQVM